MRLTCVFILFLFSRTAVCLDGTGLEEKLEIVRDRKRPHAARIQEIQIIARVRPTSDAIVKTIMECLDDESEGMRRMAVVCLGETKTDNNSAIERLVSFLEEKDIGAVAESSLERIGRPALGKLRLCLNSPSPLVRLRAIRLLGCIGKEAADCSPKLLSVVKEERDPELVAAAAKSLGEVRAPAEEAIPALVKLIRSGRYEEAQGASISLGKYGDRAIEVIRELLDSDTEAIRNFVRLNSLRELDPTAKAEDLLNELLNKPEMVTAAVSALARLRLKRPSTVENVIGVLKGEAPYDHRAAAFYFIENKLGGLPASRALAIALAKHLDKLYGVNEIPEAIAALGQIDESIKKILVRAICQSKDSNVREGSAVALVKLDGYSKEVVGAVSQLLLDANEDKNVKFRMIELLAKGGAECRAALPAIEKALPETDSFIDDDIKKGIDAMKAMKDF